MGNIITSGALLNPAVGDCFVCESAGVCVAQARGRQGDRLRTGPPGLHLQLSSAHLVHRLHRRRRPAQPVGFLGTKRRRAFGLTGAGRRRAHSYTIVLNSDSAVYGGDEHVLATSEYFTSPAPFDGRQHSLKVGVWANPVPLASDLTGDFLCVNRPCRCTFHRAPRWSWRAAREALGTPQPCLLRVQCKRCRVGFCFVVFQCFTELVCMTSSKMQSAEWSGAACVREGEKENEREAPNATHNHRATPGRQSVCVRARAHNQKYARMNADKHEDHRERGA